MLLKSERLFQLQRFLQYGAIAVILSGCATANSEIPRFAEMLANTSGQNGRACIRQYDIRGYGVLERNLVSIDGGRRYYLATVLPGCNDLQASMGVMFSGDFHEICGQSMDRIVTGSNWCSIDQIFEFGSREEAFDVYDAISDQRQALKQQQDAEN